MAPTQAVALFRCGLLELQAGQAAAASALLGRAVAAAPDEPAYRLGLGEALQAQARFAEAEALFRPLAAAAGSADARFGLGNALQSQGRYAEAAEAYDRALLAEPGHFAALNNLGICLQRCRRFEAAAAAYSRAAALRPTAAGTRANLGTVLQALGRSGEALAALRTAVRLEPAIDAHALNLGIALCAARAFVEAAQVLEAVLARNPDSTEATFNLAIARSGLGRTTEAADLYRQVVRVQPGHADAWVNLGNIHAAAGAWAAAAAAYAAALISCPDCLAALNNAACVWRTLGRLDEAEDLLRRGLELHPQAAVLHDTLGSVLKDAGALEAAIESFRRAVALDPTNATAHGNLAYASSFQSADPAVVRAECERWGARFGIAPPVPPRPRAAAAARTRLRIGYVSPDFREHCQSLFTHPLLAHHDRSAFEIVCYASVQRPDDCTRRLMALADTWRDVRTLDDRALAATIQDDDVDVLVDLTMHMAHGRLGCFALRPAPIQVAWLAYPGTTGLAAMDYRITDPRLDPPGNADHYSERSSTLPDTFWCYDPYAGDRTAAAAGTLPQVNSLPALTSPLTFGCLSNPCKLTDGTLRLWGRVMGALPHARLLVLVPPGRRRSELRQRLAAAGIAPERVAFEPYRTRAEYLRVYHRIDVCLDTLPYNGHTTSLDALWMGVPTLSRVGTTVAGRAGLSQSFHVGLAELACDSDAGFIATALALCADLPRLAALRFELRSTLQRSPLMDAPRFARNMEAAYRLMRA